jgi:hypothetical protein
VIGERSPSRAHLRFVLEPLPLFLLLLLELPFQPRLFFALILKGYGFTLGILAVSWQS